MSDSTSLQAQRLDQMKEGDKTFKVENKVLVVGAKLRIEGALVNKGYKDANNPNHHKSVQLRLVTEESDDEQVKLAGVLVKTVISENGKLVEMHFDYVPDNGNDWSEEDFCVNSATYHDSRCVRASVVTKMMCVCDVPLEAFCP